jgi:hypothetical protein
VQHYNRTFTDAHGHKRKTVGFEYVHIAIDDHSRLAYAGVLPDEKALTVAGFLRRAVRFYRRYGITVERVLTDNGPRLHRDRTRDRLPSARPQTPPHTPPSAADQHQGRALHPHPARRLGLRRHLPLQSRTQ